MSYYPTIEDDIQRARRIVTNGLYGGDTYAAIKLLESLCDEVERLQRFTGEGLRQFLPENPALYDAARNACHTARLPWTDPRTGVTHPPPPFLAGDHDEDHH